MRNSCFTAYDAEGNSYVFEETKTERGILLTLKREKLKAIRDLYALGDFTAAQPSGKRLLCSSRMTSTAQRSSEVS